MSRFRTRLTYANVTASLALVLALTGGAYAATQLPANSIGTKQIKNHAVTLGKISNSAQSALRGNAGPSGHDGVNGRDGQDGVNGRDGQDGVNGRDGSAVAFVHVTYSGTFDHAKNVSAVSPFSGLVGTYCLTVTVPVSNVTATIDNSLLTRGFVSFILAGQDPSGVIASAITNHNCPAGTNAMEATQDSAGNGAALGFWAQFN